MQNYKIDISIISLQEYLDEISYGDAEEVFEDFGIVAKHYVYARLYDDTGLAERCFVPIQCGCVEEAICEATKIVADHFKWLRKKGVKLG